MSHPPLILVVDSREESLILFHQVLLRAGYDVVLAASAVEGLAQTRRHGPDLILMDPAMAGSALLAGRLRSDPRSVATPIAALTAGPAPADASLHEAGYCGAVAKRSPMRALLDTVRRCLDSSGGSAEWPTSAAAVPA